MSNRLALQQLYDKHKGRCFFCGKTCRRPGRRGRPVATSPTRDHYIPKAYGGKGSSLNIVLACFRCNNGRGCLSVQEWDVIKLVRPGKHSIRWVWRELLGGDGVHVPLFAAGGRQWQRVL